MIAPVYSFTDQRTRIAELEQALAEEQALRMAAEDRMLALMDVIEHPDRPSPRTLLLTVYADYCAHFGQPHTRHSLAQAVGCSLRTITRTLNAYPHLANYLELVPADMSYEPAQPVETTTLSPMTEVTRTNLSHQAVAQRTKLSSKPATRTNLSHQPTESGAQRTILSNETDLSPTAHTDGRFVQQPQMTNLSSQYDSSRDTYNYSDFEATNRSNESNSNINNNYRNLDTTNRQNESSYTNPSQKLDVTNRQNESAHFTELEENLKRFVQRKTPETTLPPRKPERARNDIPFKGAAPRDIYQCIIDYSRLMSDYGPDAERINVARIRAYYQAAVPDKITHEQFYALMQEASEKAARCACRSLKQSPDGNTVIARMKIFWAIFESLLGFKIRKGVIEPMLT